MRLVSALSIIFVFIFYVQQSFPSACDQMKMKFSHSKMGQLHAVNRLKLDFSIHNLPIYISMRLLMAIQTNQLHTKIHNFRTLFFSLQFFLNLLCSCIQPSNFSLMKKKKRLIATDNGYTGRTLLILPSLS